MTLTAASVNGIQCNTSWGVSPHGGDTSLDENAVNRIDISMDTLRQYYEATEMTDIELHFLAWGLDFEPEEVVIQIYPYGDDAIVKFSREEQEIDQVVIDNEYIKVIILAYESEKMLNDTVYLFVENKTEEKVTLAISEAYANDVDLEIQEHLEQEPINGSCCSFTRFSLADRYLTDRKIKEIGTIEALELIIKLYSHDNEDESVLINESIILKP